MKTTTIALLAAAGAGYWYLAKRGAVPSVFAIGSKPKVLMISPTALAKAVAAKKGAIASAVPLRTSGGNVTQFASQGAQGNLSPNEAMAAQNFGLQSGMQGTLSGTSLDGHVLAHRGRGSLGR